MSPRFIGRIPRFSEWFGRPSISIGAPRIIRRRFPFCCKRQKDAYPDLSKQFTYEAARKSTEAKEFQQARDLLTQLLKDSPYNAEYLAAMADAYAQAGDDHGLQQFYADKIALFRSAPLPADARKSQIAVLRRGLIPALTA